MCKRCARSGKGERKGRRGTLTRVREERQEKWISEGVDVEGRKRELEMES